MDPFTLAIATFGVQKLRGKSTRRALRDAAIVGGGSYAVGASGILGQGSTFGTGAPLSGIQSLFGQKAAMAPKGNLGPSFLNKANLPAGTVIGTDKCGNEIISRGGELSGLNVKESGEVSKGIANLLEKVKEKPIQSALVGFPSVLPLFAADEEVKPPFSEEDYEKEYQEQAKKLAGAFKPVAMVMQCLQDLKFWIKYVLCKPRWFSRDVKIIIRVVLIIFPQK